MTDDQKLLERLLTKDKSAAREFYLTYSPRLLNFIRKRVGNEADVEEIAQDTLFAFLDAARDFTGRASLNTYLCAIAYNKIVDFYRKRKLKRIVFSQLPEGLLPLITDNNDPQRTLDNSLLAQKISAIFGKLTPHYAHMLKLKYVEGRSVMEIATMLAISFKSAESVLFRARRAFVKIYVTGEK